MNLYEALQQVASVGNLDVDQLLEYANEDKVAGKNQNGYSPISVTRDEGRVLYALVRYLKPDVMVEVGSHSGCSATHILAAMHKNKRGHLYCVDPGGIVPPGIPDKYQGMYTVVLVDARYYEWPDRVDALHEDGDHTADLTSKTVSAAIAHGAKFVVSHDAHNASVGGEVTRAFNEATDGHYQTIEIDECGLGIAYWFKQ